MLKILLSIITIVLLTNCHGKGNLSIAFSGEKPLKVEFDDFGQAEFSGNSLSINPLGYGYFRFKISYPSGEFLILNLCNQNNWYKERIIIEKSDKNKVVIHHKKPRIR